MKYLTLIQLIVGIVAAALVVAIVRTWFARPLPNDLKPGRSRRDLSEKSEPVEWTGAPLDYTEDKVWYPELDERIDQQSDAPVRSEQRSGSAPK